MITLTTALAAALLASPATLPAENSACAHPPAWRLAEWPSRTPRIDRPGSVSIAFDMSRDGEVQNVRVLDRSGSDRAGDILVDRFERARFEPISDTPTAMTGCRITLDTPDAEAQRYRDGQVYRDRGSRGHSGSSSDF